ncbi:MAG: hypothetical protein H7255_03785, partial [Ramlibacter sp.]|nr:hypothetical protein [Ramlibacter sp.]
MCSRERLLTGIFHGDPERQELADSGSSIFALERLLQLINPTVSWRKRPFVLHQPVSVPPYPPTNGPSWWRTSVGISGGIESEMVARLERLRLFGWSTHGGTNAKGQGMQQTLTKVQWLDRFTSKLGKLLP